MGLPTSGLPPNNSFVPSSGFCPYQLYLAPESRASNTARQKFPLQISTVNV